MTRVCFKCDSSAHAQVSWSGVARHLGSTAAVSDHLETANWPVNNNIMTMDRLRGGEGTITISIGILGRHDGRYYI